MTLAKPDRGYAWLWPALIALLFVAAFITPLRTVDLWWHLDSGRWMLEHGQYLGHEIRSFSIAGKDWPNFSWLFQVVIAGVEWLGGEWGLMLLKAATWWLILFLLFRSSETRDMPLALLLSVLAFSWQIFPFMHLRPHLFEGVFLAWAVLLFQRGSDTRKPLDYALLIILWANCHASAVVGAAALALHYVIGPHFRLPSRRILLRRGPVGLLLWALVFATPNGLGILDVLAGHAGGEYLHLYIREWFAPETLPPLMFVALAAIVAVSIVRGGILTPAEALLIALFLVIGGGSKRFLYELGLLLIRPTSVLIGLAISRFSRKYGPRGHFMAWIYGLSLAAVLIAIYRPPLPWTSLHADDFPVRERNYPHVAMNLLRPVLAAEKELRVWNAYGWGGYLGWQGKGRLKVFIDGRTPTVFTEEMMLQEKLAQQRPRMLRALLERWDVDVVVLRRGRLLPIAPVDPDWILVGFDELSVIYLRSDLARRYRLPRIGFDPFTEWPRLAPWQVEQAVSAVRKLLAVDGDNALAWQRLGQLLGYLSPDAGERELAEAKQAFERAIALRPENGTARLELARLRQKMGEDNRQVAQPLLDSSGRPHTLGLLGHEEELASLLLDTDHPQQALDVLSPDEWRHHQQLDGRFGVWLLRLEAYTRLGRSEEAGFAERMARLLALDAGPGAEQRLQAILRDRE